MCFVPVLRAIYRFRLLIIGNVIVDLLVDGDKLTLF